MVSRLGSIPESPGEGTPEGDTPSPLEAAHWETEAKFLIEDAAHVGDLIDSLDSYDVESATAADIVDDYWDTPGWHLFRAGWAYRWRDRSGDRSMTLKSYKLRDRDRAEASGGRTPGPGDFRRTAVTLWLPSMSPTDPAVFGRGTCGSYSACERTVASSTSGCPMVRWCNWGSIRRPSPPTAR